MLKRFFRWLWCPGPCRWEIKSEDKVFDPRTDSELPVGRMFVLRCPTCGEIKKKTLSA